MRDLDEHVAHALSLVAPLAPVTVPLAQAWGTVAAVDHVAVSASPVFDNSAMDGYAVRAAEVAQARDGAPVTMPVTGETAAGGAPGVLAPGGAWRIMTGAPVPDGADAVVPVEMTDGGLETVAITAAVPQGRHVRLAGEDCAVGDVVVSAGAAMSATALAALASVGVSHVAVVGAPRVALLTTGDELVEPGTALEPGQIPDSNGTLLSGLVREAGGVPVVLPRASDDPTGLRDALSGVDADLIITTGGVSVGAYDVVKAALSGGDVEFVKVAMQPGKPQGVGVLDGTPIVCLPGNPVSVLVSFAMIVRPMLDRLAGRVTGEVTEHATVVDGWRSPEGRRQLMPVRWVEPGAVTPATAGGSGSHLVASLAQAQALADVPAHVEHVEAGTTVRIVRWSR
ncbi:gephyrin-like molybdotransferase Glp [Demequina sp.]|uniref:molybdopterin molybdotransferase MoeA n=1 Tax=Demequina sp. TaxID=2050685 RepID=UPI003A849726